MLDQVYVREFDRCLCSEFTVEGNFFAFFLNSVKTEEENIAIVLLVKIPVLLRGICT